MRGIARNASTAVVAHCRDAVVAWDWFWFTPSDPSLLGLLRILTGAMLVYTHAVWGLALAEFFGPRGWQDPVVVQGIQDGQIAWSLWWWVPEPWLFSAHYVALTVFALFTIGLFTRVTSWLSLIFAISYAYRAPAALFGLDQINVMLTLYLAIGASGQALSVDRLWKRYRSARKTPSDFTQNLSAAPSVRSNLGLRLIQIHMCVIYFFAAISKLQGEAWWNGEAMWLAFANLEYQSRDMTFLAAHPWIINLMTHVTILWELSFAALIWSRTMRPLVLIVGVLLHLGIGAFLGMWTFGLVMLIGCASFLPPTTGAFIMRLGSHNGKARRQEFDEPPLLFTVDHDIPATVAQDQPAKVLCICAAESKRAQFEEYLERRGFDPIMMADTVNALEFLPIQHCDAVVLVGTQESATDLSNFQNQIETSGSSDKACLILLSPAQRELANSLRLSRTMRVLPPPVSLHDVREQLEDALAQLNSASAPNSKITASAGSSIRGT